MDWNDLADLVMQGVTSSVLSQDVLYRKKESLDWFTVSGVFSRQYIGLDQTTGEQYVGHKPALTVRDADIPNGPELGDHVKVDGVTYRVDKREADGSSAGTTVLLKKAGI